MAKRTDRIDVVSRARACVGVRFRPHGRAPGEGLDCVGLVAFANRLQHAPTGYALHGGTEDRLVRELRLAGFRSARSMRSGDTLVLHAGFEQLHLGVWTGTTLIHADAGLRRVVERPGLPSWPIAGIWRHRARRK
jgi:hypothetical protein